MNQNFKIRKNKSLKDIKIEGAHSQRPFSIAEHSNHFSKQKINRNVQKNKHLQPLLATKASLYRETFERQQLKLDFTQPVSIKSISLTRNCPKQEDFHLAPLQTNGPRLNSLNKQNRPNSMNDFKYPAIGKMKQNLNNTDKYDSLKRFAQIEKQNLKTEKDVDCSSSRRIYQIEPSKMKLLKSSSRSKLVKINQKDSNPFQMNYENGIQMQPDHYPLRTFRKGIIDKIFKKNKKQNSAKLESQETNELTTNHFQNQQFHHKNTYTQFQSPEIKKDLTIHWGNCSTIKEQEQSASSFISKNPFEQSCQNPQYTQIAVVNEDKYGSDRRFKLELQKMKKKFPQNFFK